MESNPWKTLQSKTHYDNPWVRVEEHQVIRPDGDPGIYGTVHFKNLAIGIVPLDEEQHTWLVGQYRYPLKAYSWEIPAGGGDPKEAPLVAAKRELEEETGIVAKRWDPLLTTHLSNSVTDEKSVTFLAQDLNFQAPNPEPTEQLQVRRVSLDAALAEIEQGKITDALTILSLHQLKLRLLRK